MKPRQLDSQAVLSHWILIPDPILCVVADLPMSDKITLAEGVQTY